VTWAIRGGVTAPSVAESYGGTLGTSTRRGTRVVARAGSSGLCLPSEPGRVRPPRPDRARSPMRPSGWWGPVGWRPWL